MTEYEILVLHEKHLPATKIFNDAAIIEFARAIEAATLERAAVMADDIGADTISVAGGSIAKAIRAMKQK